MMTRDYLSVKVWDLNMENRPVETYQVQHPCVPSCPRVPVPLGVPNTCPCLQVHEYLRSKLCSLYENDCIFDKFECCWNGSDR